MKKAGETQDDDYPTCKDCGALEDLNEDDRCDYCHAESSESIAREFQIGTDMICPICNKEIDVGNTGDDGQGLDYNNVNVAWDGAGTYPQGWKMQDHFEQEHKPSDFGIGEAWEDWKTGNQLYQAFDDSFPSFDQHDAHLQNMDTTRRAGVNTYNDKGHRRFDDQMNTPCPNCGADELFDKSGGGNWGNDVYCQSCGWEGNVNDTKYGESKAKEFKPELQGKSVNIIGGEHEGKSGVVGSVEIFGDSIYVNIDGKDVNIEDGDYVLANEGWKPHIQRCNESVDKELADLTEDELENPDNSIIRRKKKSNEAYAREDCYRERWSGLSDEEKDKLEAKGIGVAEWNTGTDEDRKKLEDDAELHGEAVTFGDDPDLKSHAYVQIYNTGHDTTEMESIVASYNGTHPDFVGAGGNTGVYKTKLTVNDADRLVDHYKSMNKTAWIVEYADESGLYGYGSATGRMPPAESWNQQYLGGGDSGLFSEKTMSDSERNMFREFEGLQWSELPADIQELWKSIAEYIPSGEARANEAKWKWSMTFDANNKEDAENIMSGLGISIPAYISGLDIETVRKISEARASEYNFDIKPSGSELQVLEELGSGNITFDDREDQVAYTRAIKPFNEIYPSLPYQSEGQYSTFDLDNLVRQGYATRVGTNVVAKGVDWEGDGSDPEADIVATTYQITAKGNKFLDMQMNPTVDWSSENWRAVADNLIKEQNKKGKGKKRLGESYAKEWGYGDLSPQAEELQDIDYGLRNRGITPDDKEIYLKYLLQKLTYPASSIPSDVIGELTDINYHSFVDILQELGAPSGTTPSSESRAKERGTDYTRTFDMYNQGDISNQQKRDLIEQAMLDQGQEPTYDSALDDDMAKHRKESGRWDDLDEQMNAEYQWEDKIDDVWKGGLANYSNDIGQHIQGRLGSIGEAYVTREIWNGIDDIIFRLTLLERAGFDEDVRVGWYTGAETWEELNADNASLISALSSTSITEQEIKDTSSTGFYPELFGEARANEIDDDGMNLWWDNPTSQRKKKLQRAGFDTGKGKPYYYMDSERYDSLPEDVKKALKKSAGFEAMKFDKDGNLIKSVGNVKLEQDDTALSISEVDEKEIDEDYDGFYEKTGQQKSEESKKKAREILDSETLLSLALIGNPEYPPDDYVKDRLLAFGLIDHLSNITPAGSQALQDHDYQDNDYKVPEAVDDFAHGTTAFVQQGYDWDDPEVNPRD